MTSFFDKEGKQGDLEILNRMKDINVRCKLEINFPASRLLAQITNPRQC
jgi:hypothetical protein